jgi:hypothetical protein
MNDPAVLKEVSGPWKPRIVWQDGFRVKAYVRKHSRAVAEGSPVMQSVVRGTPVTTEFGSA